MKPASAWPPSATCLAALGAQEVRLVATRDNSRVFHARGPSGEWAVKRCVRGDDGEPDPAAARLEHDSLERVARASAASGTPRLAPIPAGLFEEEATLAMSWEPGLPMTRCLLQSGPMTARGLGEAAGRWLRRFHGLRALPAGRSDFETKLTDLHQDFALARGSAGDPLLGRALRALEHGRGEAEAVELATSWIHGDFKSDNLMVGNSGEIMALDIQLRHENTVTHDLVSFLVHLDLLGWSPAGLMRRRRLAEAGLGLLQAYFDGNGNGWQRPLAWQRTENLLQRCLTTWGARDMARRWQHQALRRTLAVALVELQGC